MKKVAALVGLALALAGCGDRASVATVNGVAISRDDLFQHLSSKPKVQVSVNGQRVDLPVTDTLAFQAIRDLVSQRILVQMAREEKVEPTQADIDKEISFRDSVEPGFVTLMKQRGLSMDSIRHLLEIDICQFRLQTSGVKVADAEVDSYIKANPKQFVQPEQVDLAWIVVSSEEKRSKAQKALESGMDFKSAAREYSEAAGASTNGGQYQIHETNALAPALREKVSTLQPGQTTDWLKDQTGLMKFQLISRTPEKPIAITTAKREMVRRQMMMQRGSQARDLTKQLADRLKQANVKMADDNQQALWSSYLERLKDANVDKSRTDVEPKVQP
jgi:parvulin-like peptidyl-prolyl isomerase